MGCLKCGRETEENQVFCSECRQVMDRYPVKPGTLVQLPHRSTAPQEKKAPHRRNPSAEEANAQLRSIIRWLTATVAILTVLICLLAGILIHTLEGRNDTGIIGRNYTTADQTQQDD